ncbi:hypothetical protein EJB05_32371, partial [Eragrostis curvula]
MDASLPRLLQQCKEESILWRCLLPPSEASVVDAWCSSLSTHMWGHSPPPPPPPVDRSKKNINIACYYVIGVPMGILLGWVLNLGVMGIRAGMIGGTAVQTLVLTIISVRCNWEKEAMIASTRMKRLSHVR